MASQGGTLGKVPQGRQKIAQGFKPWGHPSPHEALQVPEGRRNLRAKVLSSLRDLIPFFAQPARGDGRRGPRLSCRSKRTAGGSSKLFSLTRPFSSSTSSPPTAATGMSKPNPSPPSHLATRMAGEETSAWEDSYKQKVPWIMAELRRGGIPLKDAEDLIQVKSLRFFETAPGNTCRVLSDRHGHPGIGA